MDDENETPLKDVAKKRRWKLRRPVLRKRHIFVVLMELVAIGALLLVAAMSMLVWRLMSGPVDMGFAKSYIQEALRIPEQGLTPTVDDIVLSWPDLNGPILLGFKNAKIYDKDGKAIVAVDEAALSLSKAGLLIGRISPVALIVRQPVVQVVRTADGHINFGIVGVESQPDSYGPHRAQEDTGIERIMRYIARPGREHSGLGTLEAIRIEGAKLVIEDQALKSSWVMPRMDASFESENDHLSSDVYLQFSEKDDSSFLRATIDMPWDTREAVLKGELKNFDPWFFVQRFAALKDQKKGGALFNGSLTAVVDPELMPLQLAAQLSSPEGTIVNTDLSKDPIAYKNFNIELYYDKDKQKLVMKDTQLTVHDLPIRADADFNMGSEKIGGAFHLKLDKIQQSKIGELWPPVLEGDNAKEWIVDKLSEGTFTNLFADIGIEGVKTENAPWSFNASNIVAGFDFEGMKVDYRPPLFPVTKGVGKGVFDLAKDRLDIEVTSGKIAELDVMPSKLGFMDIVAKGKGSADIDVNLKGPLATGLRYVMEEPIHMSNKFDPEKVKGELAANVKLTFPTRKDIKLAEMKIGITGTLSNVFLPGVVKDMSVIGGPLNLKVEGNDVVVSGSAELGGRPASFEYKEFLKSEGQPYKYSVQAKLGSDTAMRKQMGIDIDNFLDGVAPIDVTYTKYHDNHASVEAKGDLGPAHLFIGPFDYDKKEGVAGTVELKATLQDDVVKEVTGLSVEAPDLKLTKANLKFREKDGKTVLAGGDMGSFEIGKTKGSMNFTVEDSGRYNIKANSPFFDLGPFVDEEKRKPPKPDDPAMLIDLSADQMLGADDKTMPPGRFVIDMTGQGIYNRLEVNAMAGQGAVSIVLKNDTEGRRAFHFDAADAGAALRAFGIYKNIRGGTLSIAGTAAQPGDMNMKGKGTLSNFTVVNAPTLAKLVSAMSLPGLASLLSGEGLGFSKLEADYIWHSHEGGSVLEINDGRTSGNSVGFSFEGNINLADSSVNMSGTMVPLSEVNKILKSIPLVGEILTGGSGLIAATYSVKGKANSPGVMVNPLSVLTPGILRRILFE